MRDWKRRGAERWAALAATVLLALAPGAAAAHKASDSYLSIDAAGGRGAMRWAIALRDLDQLLDLDRDGDGALSWGEVRRRLPEIRAHSADWLVLNGGGCRSELAPLGVERRVDGSYLALGGHYACTGTGLERIDYRLMRDLDPTHRGLLRLDTGDGRVRTLALDPSAGAVSVADGRQADAGLFSAGVHHILAGYDHLAFLLCLLLPAVLVRTADGWRPVGRPGEALRPAAVTVTLFTLAHSITLALATLGAVRLPASIVEPAIAATIAVAGLDNVWGILGRRNKIYNFLFGLIHGFGFAAVLTELHLPRGGFALALLQFNLGVEAGQLAVVAVALSLLYGLRRRPGYAETLLPGTSLVAAALATVWLVERVFDLRLIS